MEGGGRTGACPWWEGVGALPPLENEKKILSEEILTSFTYVLLMKLGGGRSIHYTCKLKEGGRTCACPWWEGVGGYGGGRGGFAPLENEQRKGEYRPQSAVRVNRRNIFVL